MRFRNVLQEFEAHLTPTETSQLTHARGKAEWKTYADGARKSKLSLSNLDVPDGSVLDVVVAGRQISQLVVQRGTARYRRETENGEEVPVVEENEVLQVLRSGLMILEGRFVSE